MKLWNATRTTTHLLGFKGSLRGCNRRMVSMTFAMIKPEAVAFPHVTMAIFRKIFSGGLEVVGAKRIQLSANDAKQLYGIHSDKFFYERLIRHVTSGPVIVMQLRSKNDDAIECWRRLMGPSKLLKSLKESERTSLRAEFAISDTRNLVHGADSTQRAVVEMRLFAPYPPLHLNNILAHSVQ